MDRLSSSKREFKFMSRDIDAIVRGFKNNKITTHIKSSHGKLHELVTNMKKIEKRLDRTSKQAKGLRDNLHNGHKFMDSYEKLFSNLPDSLVNILNFFMHNGDLL